MDIALVRDRLLARRNLKVHDRACGAQRGIPLAWISVQMKIKRRKSGRNRSSEISYV